jgi:hypothetical protein
MTAEKVVDARPEYERPIVPRTNPGHYDGFDIASM